MDNLEKVIHSVYMNHTDAEDIWVAIAREVRTYLYYAMLSRASAVAGTDYRLGYEDGIKESARWLLGDA